MAFINHIEPVLVNNWIDNFENLSNNIFSPFQDNEILLPKTTYQQITNNGAYNVRIYLGIGSENSPKVLALGTYFVANGDSEVEGYVDIVGDGKIYEVYGNSAIDVNLAKGYINNWKSYSGSDLFKIGYLIPKPTMMKFFEEDGIEYLRLFFGYDGNEVKLLAKDPMDIANNIVMDKSKSCPIYCDLSLRLIQ